MPSARPRALGNDDFCRVPDLRHSANMWHTACPHFAECWPSAKNGTRHTETLSSAGRRALGKDRSRAQHARPPCTGRQGAWRPLSFAECCKGGTRQSVNFAKCLCSALGKASFAECHPAGTRQIVCIFIFLSFKIFYNQLKFENLIPGSIWYFHSLVYCILLFFLFAGNICWSYF